jgi:superfamily II DNA or RNA helicase
VLRDFRPGSLLILDEAHHAAPASGRKIAAKISAEEKDIFHRVLAF